MASGLSVDLVTSAGVGLVRKEGWSALSLRAVASALEVTPMALYRYVPNSDALASAVLDAVVDGCASVTDSGDPGADLSDWARRFRADLLAHPGVAGHLMTHWFECPPMLERIEQLLELVHRHHVTGFDAVAATNAVFTYVLMRAETEQRIRTAGVVRRQLRLANAQRPLPRLTALAQHYATAEVDKHFAFGLAALLAGMNLDRKRRS